MTSNVERRIAVIEQLLASQSCSCYGMPAHIYFLGRDDALPARLPLRHCQAHGLSGCGLICMRVENDSQRLTIN
jgi:hypothetical protein